MDAWQHLQETIEVNINELRVDLLKRVENAKKDEILAAIKIINNRLDSIERRLPEPEFEDT